MMAILSVALGGALGAASRYGLGLLFPYSAERFPIAVLLANLAGCLLLGFFVQHGVSADNHPMRLLLITGFCGGFTTLSAFTFELHTLLRSAQHWHASLYFVGTLAGALASFYAGLMLARLLLKG